MLFTLQKSLLSYSFNTNTLILTPAALCSLLVLADRMFFPRLYQEMLHDHTQHCDVLHLQDCQQNVLRHLMAKKINIIKTNKRHHQFSNNK